MKQIGLYFLILIALSSCGNNIVKKPKNLIEKETMIAILYDLSIIEALHNTSYNNAKFTFNSNNYILKKYKIDSLQFAKSNQYYASDVKGYKKMYEAINDKLTDNDAAINKKIVLKTNKTISK